MTQEIYSLKKDTQELHAALWQGKVTHYGEDWIALPREVIRPGESVIFEITRVTDLNKPSLAFILWKAIRPETFYWSVVPFVLICLFGMTQGAHPAWGVGLCSLLGIFFLQMAVRFWSDVEDHLRLVDLASDRFSVLRNGWISAKEMKLLGNWALGMGVGLGLPALWVCPQWIFALGVIGVLGLVGFAKKPWSLKYRGFQDVLILIWIGPLLCLGYAQSLFHAPYGSGTLPLGLCLGALACAIPHASHLQDFKSAQKSGIEFRFSRHLFLCFYLFAYGVLGVASVTGFISWGFFWSAMTVAPWVLGMIVRVYQASGPVSALLGEVKLQALRIYVLMGCSLSAYCLLESMLQGLS